MTGAAVQAAPATTRVIQSGDPARGEGCDVAVTRDVKQHAVWLLHEAREQMAQGNFDAAEKKIAEAEAIDVKWGLFDDTPAKVRTGLNKQRPKNFASTSKPAQSLPHNRETAHVLLREARAALANHQIDQAEAIAQEVKSWNLSYSFFGDNPDKVAAAARALRKRDKIRNPPPVAEHEANDLLDKGDQAKAAAKVAESEKLRDKESGRAAIGQAPATAAPAVDASIQRSSGALPAPEPLPAAPGANGSPTPDKPAASALDSQPKPEPAGQRDAPVALAPADQPKNPPGQPDQTEPAKADAPVAPAPADQPNDQPPAPPETTQSPAGKGRQMLASARALYTSGNYPAARQMAEDAKAGQLGVDGQADELLAQIGLAEQGGALSLYESALAAMRSGENARARALLTEVAAAGASLDENLLTKVQELLKKLSADDKAGSPKGTAVVGEKSSVIPDAEALAAQKLNAEVGTKIAEARRLQETDPDKAIAIYEQTMKAVKSSGLSPNLMRPMLRRLEVALELAKKDKTAFEVKMQNKQERAEIELKRLRILEADKAKKARLKEFMDKAQGAYAEGNYAECEAYAKRAAEVDPNEVAATMLVFKAKTERHYKQDLEIRAAKDEGALTAFQEVDLASVADPEVQLNSIKLPKNFKDLTRERLRMNARLEVKKDPKVLAIEAKLKDTVSLNVDKQPLSEAITFLQNYTGLNIVLDPKALNDEGLTSAAPVSLTVNNVQVKTALKLLLRPLGLTYRVEDEVLLITSPSASTAQMHPKTYYVGDLIMPVNKGQWNPMAAVSNQNGSPNSADGAGAMGQVGALANPGQPPATPDMSVSKGDRPQVDMTPLIQLITTSIAPGTWRVQDSSGQDISPAYGLGQGFGGPGGGGGIDAQERPPGSIIPFYLSISLIIRHTAEVHEQVADLLRQLRRLQDLQVAIEVRFITVSDNFFEQIGVDFDFQIQSDTVGKHSTFAFPNPSATLIGVPGTPTTGTTATTGTTGTTGTSTGTTGTTGTGGLTGGAAGGTVGGAGTTAGTTGGTTGGASSVSTTPAAYLVNPIRDHAYPNQTPLVVGTAGGGLQNFSGNLMIPFNNTQGGLIAPTNAIPGSGATLGLAFLSDVEVYFFLTAAQGDTRANVLQAPKVTTFNGASATILNAQLQWYVAALTPIVGPGSVAFVPTPAPLPNGVVLTVTPVVSADRRYVRLTISPVFNTIAGFTTIQVPAAVGGSGLGGGAATINATLQLPQTDTTTVNTTVTVPDGGTVLLGGVKQLNEQRLEYGVPVLSKIPWLDRLFRNVGIGRVSTSLMLMVTPRIIILEEEEEKLGIPSTAL